MAPPRRVGTPSSLRTSAIACSVMPSSRMRADALVQLGHVGDGDPPWRCRASAPPPSRGACRRRSARARGCRRPRPPRPRAALRGRGVEAEVERDQHAPAVHEPAQQRRERGRAGGEIAEARDDERVRLALGDLRERPLQRRPRTLLAGNVVHHVAERDDPMRRTMTGSAAIPGSGAVPRPRRT